MRALIVGNSDGIGLATTHALLAAGWEVAGVSRRAVHIGDPGAGARYGHLVADVTAPDYRARLGELVAARGPFDACLYCAGIGEPLDPADLADEARTFAVNLDGAVATAAVVVPAFVAAGAGHLILLSSLADELVSAEAPAYPASKAALSAWSDGLALALAPRGVAVTCLRFGFVDTKMAKAGTRPFLITPERAARVILGVLRRPRARVSYPWRMAVLVRLLRLGQRWRLLWHRPARRGGDR